MGLESVKGYEALLATMRMAFDRVAKGKGSERHRPCNEDFQDQLIVDIPLRMPRVGEGFSLGQIIKKAYEIDTFDEDDKKVREALDIMTYAAGYVIYMYKKNGKLEELLTYGTEQA